MSTIQPGNSTTRQIASPHAQKRNRGEIEDRKRATRACDQCRRLKEKCEGGTPCHRCQRSRRMCEFKSLASQAHDTRQRIDTVRGASDAEDLQKRLMLMERILKHKLSGISLDTESLSRLAQSISVASTDIEEDAVAIDEEVPTIEPVENTTTHYSGEWSLWNFSMRVKRHINDQLPNSDTATRPVSDELPNYWRPERATNGESPSVASAIRSCPPRQVADFLVKMFFKCTEKHYYYVDQDWLLENLNCLYDNPANFGAKGAVNVSIILTVLAIGTQYAYLDSPRQKKAGTPPNPFSEDEIGAMFFQQAIRLLPEIIELSCLESVQACLLFGVYSLPVDASGLGYVYLNLALRLAMQNGMHRKYAGNALTPVMVETRNRVWWTAFMLERKISIFHGRPLSIHRSDVDGDVPKELNKLQSHGTTSTVQYMVASIHLAQCLEDCYSIISHLRTHKKQQISTVLTDLLSAKQSLATWWHTLPEELRAHNPAPQQPARHNFRASLHLGLEYCLIRMFVGRPFLFSRVSHSVSNYSSPESHVEGVSSPGTSHALQSRNELVDDCVSAASEALGLLCTLRDTGYGLARASYIEYSSCRATLLVLIAYSIQHQSDHCRNLLQSGLNMIREMSAAGNSARSEVMLIEALKAALTRLHEAGATNTSHVERQKSDYDSFKHWSELWKSGVSPAASASGTAQHIQQTPNLTLGAVGGRELQYEVQQEILGGGSGESQTWSDWSVLPDSQMLEDFMALPQYLFDANGGMGDLLES